MKTLILYRKLTVLLIVMILLAFGFQNISYSQVSFKLPLQQDTRISQELTVDEIYDKTIQSVVWIATNKTEGSGVLIDKSLRLVVTNNHVVEHVKENEPIFVFFPMRDRHGILIDDRDFYRNEANFQVLFKLGYVSAGRVIARKPETDLAIVQIDGLPDTAHQIKHNFSSPTSLHLMNDDKLHVLGNPRGLNLWKWAVGFSPKVDQGMIKFNAPSYKGHSGSPVVNDQGMLIGIATLSNEKHTTWAVPASKIKDLLNSLQPRHVFSISNYIEGATIISYYITWHANSDPKEYTIGEKDTIIHWYEGKSVPHGYPKIHFDYIANDDQETLRTYKLKTYIRNLGSGVKPSHELDAREYWFVYDPETKILGLSEPGRDD